MILVLFIGCFLCAFCFVSEVSANGDINKFFPQLKNNLTKVTWGYPGNDKLNLELILNDNKTMMITVDTVMKDGAHPMVAENVSLQDFLKLVSEKTTENCKGVKLRFKSIEAFNASLYFIKDANPINYPLWLNADIFPGPGNSADKFLDSNEFLTEAINLSDADTVLSLGWTTTNESKLVYTNNDTQAMELALKNHTITNNITFPVRASMVGYSGSQLSDLLEESDSYSLTIFSDTDDTVDVEKLRNVILKIGIHRIFLDVPDDLREKLRLDQSNTGSIKTLSLLCVTLCILITVI